MIYEVYDSSNFLIKDAHISYNSEGTAQSSHVRRHYPFVSIEKYPYAQEKLAQPRNTAHNHHHPSPIYSDGIRSTAINKKVTWGLSCAARIS